MSTHAAVGYHDSLPASDPASLVDAQVERTELRPHDLLVRVEAVSVNPIDTKQRLQVTPDGLRVLGFDAAGTVVAVGDEVTLFAPGDEVFYAGVTNRPGSNQQFQAVDERIVGRRPRNVSFADAASLPLTSLTAWECLFDRLGLTAASSGHLLVIGATGGVGAVMLQLAEVLLPDVEVLATASDEERGAWVRRLGAEHVVNHRGDLVEEVLRVAPGGVDWVFSSHSQGQIPAYVDLTRPGGHIVAIDNGPADVTPLKPKSISWHWESMFTRALFQTPDMIEQHFILDRLADLVEAGQVRPTTTAVLRPINAANLRDAHARIESGRTAGKLVLEGWESPLS